MHRFYRMTNVIINLLIKLQLNKLHVITIDDYLSLSIYLTLFVVDRFNILIQLL